MSWIDPRMPVNWQHPLTAGLVAWWKVVPAFAGGQRLVDLTKRHHGTLQGGATWTGPRGRRGGLGALTFDGVQGTTVEIAAAPALAVTRVSVLAWVRARTLFNNESTVFAKSIGGAVNSAYAVFMGASRLVGRVVTTDGILDATEATPFPTGSWQWIGYAYDETTGAASLMRNRLEVGVATGAALPIATGVGPARLGHIFLSGTRFWLDGWADDVMVFRRPLSVETRRALYDLTQRLENPMLRYVHPRLYALPAPPPTAGVPATHRQAFAVTTRHRQAFAVTTRHRAAFEVTRRQRGTFERE